MEIRRATPADALAIATVHVRSWRAAYGGVLPQSYLDDLDAARLCAQWRQTLETTAWPVTGTLVVIDAAAELSAGQAAGADTAAITGFAHFGPTRDEDDDPQSVGELQTLYLDPLVWRRGAGSLLLGAVEKQLGEAGFATATAWTLENNDRARIFYERHGWHPDGATKFHDWGAFMATDVRYRVSLA